MVNLQIEKMKNRMSTFALTTKNSIVIFGVALTVIVSTITFLIDTNGQVRLIASRLQWDAINRPSTSLVVFTSQNLKSGDVIKSDSVELKLVKSENIPQDAIWNPEMVLGKTTKRALLNGVLLSTQDISDLNPKNTIDFGIKNWPKLRYWAFAKTKTFI